MDNADAENKNTDVKGNEGKESNGDNGGSKSLDELLKGNKEFQAELDKKITQALDTQKTKLLGEMDIKLKAERDEATKLAKLNADEKAKYEAEKREKELTKREAEIIAKELKATAKETLIEKNLPSGLADVLNYESAETCKASIETVEKAFNDAVAKAVDDKLRGNAGNHKTGSNNAGSKNVASDFISIIKENSRRK